MNVSKLLFLAFEKYFLNMYWILPVLIISLIEWRKSNSRKITAEILVFDLFVSFLNSTFNLLFSFFMTVLVLKHLFGEQIFFGYRHEGYLMGSLHFLMALVFLDLNATVWHYLKHNFSWLWFFHKYHHNWTIYTGLAASRVHPLEKIPPLIVSSVVYLLIFRNLETFALAAVAIRLQAVFTHANFDISYGWFDRVLASPRYHKIHHLVDSHYYSKNLCVMFPIFDKILGTQILPENLNVPMKFGVKNAYVFELEKPGFYEKLKIFINLIFMRKVG
ncbi:MAG: sterol desaturase family protein [Oligoflexia bacterium]|nr:sterol desaturase family protein [Oligoflexia bacterium]